MALMRYPLILPKTGRLVFWLGLHTLFLCFNIIAELLDRML